MNGALLTCFAAVLASGCVVYDPSIFDELPSRGTGGEDSGGTGGSATGGAFLETGGGGATGGAGPTGGGAGTGGEPVGGAGGGTGGTCALPAKPTPDETTKVEIDTFEVEWRKYSNSEFTGEWFSGGDANGSGLAPSVADWRYAQVGCAGSEDWALHVTGTGYTSWGVSLDATLMSEGTYDASAHAGITFVARSDDGDTIKVSFRDDTVVDAVDVPVPPLGNSWRRVSVDFPGGVDKTKLKTVSIVGIDDAEHDFMIDDLSFFAQ